MTTTTNREEIAAAVEGWESVNGYEFGDAVRECFNCREVRIDDGDIWIADPQEGHWLNDDKVATLVKFLRDRRMI